MTDKMKTLIYVKKPSTHKKNLLYEKLIETFGENYESLFIQDINSISDNRSQILVSNILNQNISDRIPRLKYLIVPTTGLDSINLNLVNERGISMFHNPKIFSEEVIRSLAPHFSRLNNKKIGLYGFGTIGKGLYYILSSSNNSFYIYRKNPNQESIINRNIIYEGNSLEEVITNSEIHIISLPMDFETINLFSGKELSLFKKRSQLISVSRKEIFNEKSLIDVINRGIFSRVLLESYYTSFLDISKNLDYIVLSDHNLGVNNHSVERMSKWVLDKIKEINN